jgi:AraC-like DNA-binding protein
MANSSTMDSNLQSRYREFLPPVSLRARMMCFWRQSIGAGGDYTHSVLPDGCVDIVWIGSSPPIVAGPATRRVLVHLPERTLIVGARFQPGWAACSLGIPAERLLNLDVPLAEIWKAPVCARAERVSQGETASSKILGMTQFLLATLASAPVPDPATLFAVKTLASATHSSLGTLTQDIGLSTRQLLRRFRMTVGYGPKMFHQIMRFQRLLWLTSTNKSIRELAEVACDVGYADQAHMCRDVLAFTAMTPQCLLTKVTSTVHMSDLFKTPGAGNL